MTLSSYSGCMVSFDCISWGEKKMKLEEWIVPLGILAIGGYFVYSFFKNSPVGQAIGAVSEGIGSTVSGIKTADETFKATKIAAVEMAKASPSFFVDNPFIDVVKKATNLDVIFPIETKAGTTGLTKTEVKQAITQMEKSYATIPKAKVNLNATPNRAALITNVLTSKTVTMNKVDPSIQIQQYNIAPKVVKVGNAFKKVM